MMTNLFSIFDPTTSIINIQFNWISSVIIMMIIPSMFWMMNNRYLLIMQIPFKMLNNEFKILINNKGITLALISIFMFIVLNNLLGLFPYIFTSTSHLTLTLTMALPLWIAFMLFGWINNTKNMLIHLVPMGTPTVLMPFMVCIETISNLIRPGTLSVRLTANMIAGHLLLTLLGNTTSIVSMKILPVMIFIQMMLLILELAVAMIQGYVFAVLSTLYASEVN